jgi:hypothetical protein
MFGLSKGRFMHQFEADEIRAVTAKLGEFEVAWGGENKIMAISGVTTFAQFQALMSKLRGSATPNVKPTEAPKAKLSAQLEVEPAKTQPAPELVEPSPEAVNQEDFSVFSRVQKLGDIVTEAMKRGAKDHDSIRSFISRLRDAEACPALDRIDKQGDFDSRLRTHCAARQIAGAL